MYRDVRASVKICPNFRRHSSETGRSKRSSHTFRTMSASFECARSAGAIGASNEACAIPSGGASIVAPLANLSESSPQRPLQSAEHSMLTHDCFAICCEFSAAVTCPRRGSRHRSEGGPRLRAGSCTRSMSGGSRGTGRFSFRHGSKRNLAHAPYQDGSRTAGTPLWLGVPVSSRARRRYALRPCEFGRQRALSHVRQAGGHPRSSPRDAPPRAGWATLPWRSATARAIEASPCCGRLVAAGRSPR